MTFLSRLRLTGVMLLALAAAARAEDSQDARPFLAGLRHNVTRASTVPDNADLNPYAVWVAPVSAGKIRQHDVLVDNFNNVSNLQGTGGTILAYTPGEKQMRLIASLPQTLAQCPGGIGLTAAMAMLRSGWIIVGSTPSTDGTTRTKGAGCLLVLDPEGRLVATWTGPNINGPWGNMAVEDRGDTASLFVTMAGFDVPGPDIRDPVTGYAVTIRKARVVRFDLAMRPGQPPVITAETLIGEGLGQRADRDVFLVGPTGLALGAGGTLYITDTLGNRVMAIEAALTRRDSAGTGREITRDGLLRQPLALTMTPSGHLLTTNAKNGQVVEIDPISGRQLAARWVNNNPVQSPPGKGNLFGLAMTPDGQGFYFVQDDVNTLAEATP